MLADPRDVDVDGFLGLVADQLLLVDERGAHDGEELGGAVFFAEKVGGCGEGEEGGVARVHKGVAQGAGEGCCEDFGAALWGVSG